MSLLGATIFCLMLSSCQSGPVAGNELGSTPLNNEEALAYKKSINRCIKMGGTRVVKIEGELRCF